VWQHRKTESEWDSFALVLRTQKSEAGEVQEAEVCRVLDIFHTLPWPYSFGLGLFLSLLPFGKVLLLQN
jgi:hypothetical protein